MNASQRTVYFLGYAGMVALLKTAKRVDPSSREWDALERIGEGVATEGDVRVLARLADLAGLDWYELFPDVMS